jgi:hypothetical protein
MLLATRRKSESELDLVLPELAQDLRLQTEIMQRLLLKH